MRVVILILLLSLPAEVFAQQRPFRERRPILSTEATVLLYANSRAEAQPFLDAAFAEMERVEGLLEASGLFSEAPPYSAVLDGEVARLINRGLGWARLSGGAFDPTAADLNELWSQNPAPPDSLIEAAKQGLGWQFVSLDILSNEIRFEERGMRLDAERLAQGYAIDAAARVLSDSGSGPALLSIGGATYRALDPPPGQNGWLINVNDPTDEGTLSSTVRLSHSALSTFPASAAADSVGVRLPDPRTGKPATFSRQATVVTGDATDAAILGAMVFVLGPESAEVVLAGTPGVRAWIIHPSSDGHSVRAIRWPLNQTP